MSFSTPILLITFNRPDHTRQVFDAIKKQKPDSLYIFQDGSRDGNLNDIEKCKEVRAIFEEPLDWNCELHTFYSTVNLGCGPGPAAGISWFFEQVEAGIIIEDDAIPADDFFNYASELLIRYKDDKDIRAIGSMKVDDKIYGDGTYYFSMMNRTLCAWATWRRAWNDFDYHLREISKKDFYKSLSFYNVTLREREYWYARLLEIQKDGYGDTSWDQQFWMSIWLKRGKGISPNFNLSSNIGFEEGATHTFDENSIAAKVKAETIKSIIHPRNTNIIRKADLRFQQLYFEPYEYGFTGFKRLPFRINKRIKRLLNLNGSWFK